MTTREPYGDEELLAPGEVAAIFRVDPKTVTRWAKWGRVPMIPDDPRPPVIRTPGGHIRFRYKVVRMIRDGELEMAWNEADRSMPAEPEVRVR